MATRFRRFVALGLAVTLSALLHSASSSRVEAAGYPQKAIQLIVSFAPGGGSDVVARVVAKHLAAELGVPVNVVNKAGGNQIPAILSVLQAVPDGYTLLHARAGPR